MKFVRGPGLGTGTGTFPGAGDDARSDSTRHPPTRALGHGVRRVLGGPLAVVLLLLGPALAWLAWREAARQAVYETRTRFGDVVSDIAHDLDAGIHSWTEVLLACGALYDSSDRVTRGEFSVFTRGARARHPSIVAIGWAPRVTAGERAAHERAAQAEGLASYRISVHGAGGAPEPAPPASVYYPILQLEPAAGNESLLGIDVPSHPARRRGLEQALAAREARATDPVRILARPGGLGVLLLLPVYPHGADEPARPDGDAMGVVVLAFRFDEVIRHAMREGAHQPWSWLDLTWSDTSVDGRAQRVHPPEDAPLPREEAPFAAVERFTCLGQEYELRATPTPAFLAAHRDLGPILVGALVFVGWELSALGLFVLLRAWRTEVLRRQARSVGLLLRSLSEGVVMSDHEGRILVANDAALRILGVTLEDLRAPDWTVRAGLLTADGQAPCPPERVPLLRAARGEVVADEELPLGRPGEPDPRVVRVRARPVLDEDDTLRGGSMVLEDVTEQRRSEGSLRRLSRAVEQTADGVLITDHDGRIVYANAGFASITGYEPTDVLGSSPRRLEAEARDDGKPFAERWGAALAGEAFRGTIPCVRKDGRRFQAQQTITPMKDAAGRVRHAVVVMRDITEHERLRETEVEMRLAAELQQRLYPQQEPRWEGLDVAGAALPAAATCGDYFDYLRFPDGRYLLVVGDVSGHGLGPALLMSETRAYVRSFVDGDVALDEILRRINAHLRADLAEGTFVSLLLVAIHPRSRRITYANAGHPPAILLDAAGAVRAQLPKTGPAMGVLDDPTYDCAEGPTMEPGDVLVLVTDGVLEARGAGGALFEESGVIEAVRDGCRRPAATILAMLQGAIGAHEAGCARRDDVTVVVCRDARVPARVPVATPSE